MKFNPNINSYKRKTNKHNKKENKSINMTFCIVSKSSLLGGIHHKKTYYS